MAKESHLIPLERASQVLEQSHSALLEAEQILNDEVVKRMRTSSTPTTVEKDDLVKKAIALDQSEQWIQWASYISTKAKKILAENSDPTNAVSLFANLSGALENLESSKCRNLLEWTKETWQVCHEHLMKMLSEDVAKTLEILKYPLVLTNPSENPIQITAQEQIRLQRSLDALREVSQLSDKRLNKQSQEKIHLDLFLEPLVKRFKFHFCSKRKTNDLAHPEWYLQQVMSWLRQGDVLFEALRLTRPVRLWIGEGNLRGLLALVSTKMNDDLKLMVDDDSLISHAIDEALLFSKDLFEHGYKVRFEDTPLVTLADNEAVFSKWMSLERKFAFERLDALFAPQHEDGYLDPWARGRQVNSVLLCEEVFITLLQSLSMKMKLFVERSQVQMQLYDLQCDLIKDFQRSLVSVLRAEERPDNPTVSQLYALIVNSAHHLAECLEGWRDVPLFLALQSDEAWSSNEEIFAHEISALKFFMEESITRIADMVYFDLEVKSYDYRTRTRWTSEDNKFELDEEQARLAPTFSVHIPSLLQTLSEHLEHLSLHLEPSLLQNVLSFLVSDIERLFLNKLIVENRFSRSGCLQLAVDMKQGLIPIIKRYFNSSNTFPKLSEALLLLLLPTATALLLKDSLEGVEAEKGGNVLKEFKISQWKPDKALCILERRLDLM